MSTRRRSRVRIAARNERGPERAGVEAVSAAPSVEMAWRDHRPYLVNLAYQMLGDVGEAEDVAQEAFLRLSRADQTELEDVRGWLTVVAGRLCLDQLRSARVRLETVLRPEHDVAGERDPADRV